VTTTVQRASAVDTAGFIADVAMPLVARGVIVRRPPVVALLDRMDGDARAVRRMQRLRDRYGPGPVLLRVPGREVAVILAAADVRRVLAESPEPFATANREKVAALSHFQPHGVLISHGAERADRRRFNEEVLDTPRPVHRFAEAITGKVEEETSRLPRQLDWDAFAVGWWQMVRRIVLGDGARDDHELTDMLRKLRGDANWAYLKPKRRRLRDRFLRRLSGHLDRAEPGSLAALVRSAHATPQTFPDEQVPQWLFAFDATAMAAFRALALLAAHPERARHDEPFFRACFHESVRLWPTTPAILRDTTAETQWGTGTLPAGAAIVVFAPFFHRDDEKFQYADVFAPELWVERGAGQDDWPLVPFSAGPAECAGRNLVLLTASSVLASLTARGELRETSGALAEGGALPRTLSPFRLRFDLGG
jgi:cytochrome P450